MLLPADSLIAKAGVVMFMLLSSAQVQNQASERSEILLDPVLRILCFAGAIGGGFMALAFFPVKPPEDEPKRETLRAQAWRWVTCSLFGGTFSPFVIDHLLPGKGVMVNTSSVLFVSSFIGLFAWSLVEGIQWFLKRKFGVPKDGGDHRSDS